MSDWKKDPRLKKMDPEKIQVLTEFSERLNRTPGPQMLSLLLSFQAEAGEKGIRLSSHMPPSEQKKLSMLRLFSRKLAARRP